MKPLVIASTVSTPAVSFDDSTSDLELSGESYPENAFGFYQPILAWLREHLGTSMGPVVFRVRVKYLNTSSVKCMMDILDTFEDAHRRGVDVAVYWYHERDNDRALEMAEEFREELSLPFHLVAEAPA